MHKKIFLCLALLISHCTIFCVNPNAPDTKAILTTLKWGTGITFACALLATIPDKESSAKEKICLITFSTVFAGILSGLVGKMTSSNSSQDEALTVLRAKKIGIVCGLTAPAIACLTYCGGKDPRKIHNFMTTMTSLNDILKIIVSA